MRGRRGGEGTRGEGGGEEGGDEDEQEEEGEGMERVGVRLQYSTSTKGANLQVQPILIASGWSNCIQGRGAASSPDMCRCWSWCFLRNPV